MTDIITHAPFATHSIRIPRLHVPFPAIGRAFDGLAVAIGAAAMAYVAPFVTSGQTQQAEPDLDGRDPRW